MKTKASVLYEVKKELSLEEIELPELKPGQVLVRISYSGICHSQLNEIKGFKGGDRFLPHTLGHEGSGVVLEVDDKVEKVQPGDKVVLSWIKGSGMDVPSTVYKGKHSLINSGALSTFMQTTITCENRLTKIPDAMPLKEATLFGCAVPTGAGIVINNAKLKKGQSIAIFGVGGVGLSALLGAKAMDAGEIIVIDVVDEKLELAKKLGATSMINSLRTDPVTKIKEITGSGVDYSIEAAGLKKTMETAFRVVRNNGGKCIIAGNLAKGEEISIDPMNLIYGKQIVGTWGGESNIDENIEKYVEWFLSGKIDFGKLITHEYKLEDINKAFHDLEQRKVGRAVINMNL